MAFTTEDLQDSQKLETTIWRLLARGAVDPKHAFKLFSMATVGATGLPDMRMVVLRSCNTDAKKLCFHTDIRSGKIAHIKKQPEVCLLFWHPKQSLQLRVYGVAEIHHLDKTAMMKIAGLPPQQIALYGYNAMPGSKLDKEKEDTFDETLVEQNFVWVEVGVHTIDALHLGRNGVHTRVQFYYNEAGLESVNYLQP